MTSRGADESEDATARRKAAAVRHKEALARRKEAVARKNAAVTRRNAVSEAAASLEDENEEHNDYTVKEKFRLKRCTIKDTAKINFVFCKK